MSSRTQGKKIEWHTGKKNIGEYLSVSTPKAHKYFYILTCILEKKKKNSSTDVKTLS